MFGRQGSEAYDTDLPLEVSGLRSNTNQRSFFPLAESSLVCEIRGATALCCVEQRFVNDTALDIEAKYQFWQESRSALYHVEVQVADQPIIVAQCKAREKAVNTYDDAVSAGHTAVLMEQSTNGVISLSIGRFPAGSSCKVWFKYVTELQAAGGRMKLVFPWTHKLPGPTARFSADIRLNMATSIQAITFNQDISVIPSISGNSARVSFSCNKLKKYLALFAHMDVPSSAFLEIDPDGNHTAVVHFLHDIEGSLDDESLSEIVFIVDQSGSMAGSKMNQAKNALQIFLRSLPVGSLFNVIGFGSQYKPLFSDSQRYNDTNFAKACSHIDSMSADMGGTDLLSPLKFIFGSKRHPTFPRQIFVLTDGECPESELLHYAYQHCGDSRIFTFGIGADASATLMTGLASIGHGKAEFVSSEEVIEEKVMLQLKFCLQPMIIKVEILWGVPGVIQVPEEMASSYGDLVICYGIFPTGATVPDTVVVRVHTTSAHSRSYDHKITLGTHPAQDEHVVARLAAKSRIKALELASPRNSEEITQIALRYSLLSSETSFVAVQKQETPVSGSMNLVACNAVKSPPTEDESIESLQKDIETLQQAMQDMNSMVQEQSAAIECLNGHVSAAACNVSMGTSELASASRYSGGSFFDSLRNMLPSFPSFSLFSRSPSVPSSIQPEEVAQNSDVSVQFGRRTFAESCKCTVGANFHTMNLQSNGIDRTVQLWDTAGQERYGALAPMYYRGAQGAIVMYSITSRESFTAAELWIKSVMSTVQTKVSFLILGNKLDLIGNREVSHQEAATLSEKYKALIFEVSVKTLSNLKEAIQAFFPNFSSEYPGSDLKVIFLGNMGVGKTSLADIMSGSVVKTGVNLRSNLPTSEVPPASVVPSAPHIPPPSITSVKPLSSVTPKVTSLAHSGPLEQLILLQTANGSWIPSAQFGQVLQLDMDNFYKSIPPQLSEWVPDPSLAKEVWATATAISIFAQRFPLQQTQWLLLSNKAQRWIGTVLSSSSLTDVPSKRQHILDAANSFIQATKSP
ncbi:von willebrand factor a [Pelomyxa schiedti]|nr:von willebrand factor a [Pelomyxa schiedti]